MAKDRRDPEVTAALQDVAVELPAPAPLEVDAASRLADAIALPPAQGAEQRMLAAADVLEALPLRERLGVLYAMLPAVLDELDAASRATILEELFLAAELTPAT